MQTCHILSSLCHQQWFKRGKIAEETLAVYLKSHKRVSIRYSYALRYVVVAEMHTSGWSLVIEWHNEANDATAQHALEALQDSIDGLARDRDLLLDFQFMNHAGPTQKVLESYGAANFDQIKSVVQSYDSDGLFQNLQNSGFLVGEL